MTQKLTSTDRRRFRTRNALRRVNEDKSGLKETRPRLCVHRTNSHIYAQVIDGENGGKILAAASSLEKDLKLAKGSDKTAARAVGKAAAERAVKAGVTKVQFDRGPYLYHGRVKEVADGAREGGVEF